MKTIKLKSTEEKQIVYLEVHAGVRYWEDAEVNGIEDEYGDLIPSRNGDTWNPIIELENGKVLNWPKGTTANIHYKVCDAGVYKLLDSEKNVVKKIDGYVPDIMCPEEEGYGDYIIMNINESGYIQGWVVRLHDFED